jgi:hypothetical protein
LIGALAELDQARILNLVRRGSASQSELDVRNNTLDQARQQVKEAWARIQETRAALGLGPDTQNPLSVPPNLVREQSLAQRSVSEISSALAQVGIPFDLHTISPGQAFEQILHLDSSQGIENAFVHRHVGRSTRPVQGEADWPRRGRAVASSRATFACRYRRGAGKPPDQ